MIDIISMQSAKKALKILNERYSGLATFIVAEEGQDEFNIGEPCDTTGHSLIVLLNGERAWKDRDFKFLSNERIKFNFKTRKGDVVVFNKSYAGIPQYSNPPYDDIKIKSDLEKLSSDLINVNELIHSLKPYDDTEIKSLISQMTGEIENIITAIDDDKDGDILDTIGNIKAQWENADGDIKKLIELKLSKDDLSTEIDKLESIKKISEDIKTNAEGIKNNTINIANDKKLFEEYKVSNDELIKKINSDVSKFIEDMNKVNEDINKFSEKTDALEQDIKSFQEKLKINFSTVKEGEKTLLVAVNEETKDTFKLKVVESQVILEKIEKPVEGEQPVEEEKPNGETNK